MYVSDERLYKFCGDEYSGLLLLGKVLCFRIWGGLLTGGWVALQYASKYSAKCSQASSSWFWKVYILKLYNLSWEITCLFQYDIEHVLKRGFDFSTQKTERKKKLHITWLHWVSLSAATIWTFMFLACDLPLDFINRCSTFVCWIFI